MTTQHRPLHGYLAALGTVAIWTGFILISRMGGKSPLTAYDILALRLAAASVLLLPFAKGIPKSAWRDRRLWLLTLLAGVLYGIFAYSAFKFAPAAHAAILLPGLQPFLIMFCTLLLFSVKPPRERHLGLFIIGMGVLCAAVPYILASSGHWSGATLVGDGLFLIASTIWAFYTILARRWHYNPWVLTRFVAFGSTAIYLPIYLLWLPKQLSAAPMSQIVIQALYQGIGPTIVAMLLFLKAVSILGAERTGAIIALVPVLSGIAAVPLLGEPLNTWLVAALGLVSLGAYLCARHLPERKHDAH
jgi:drug/metabolite transporter (DMT)-like permease